MANQLIMSADQFVNWKTVSTAATTTIFPFAGAISKLGDFFYDESTRGIYRVFGMIFSVAIVLYCHSLGVELLYWTWWVSLLLAGFLLVAYYCLLLVYRNHLPEQTGKRICVVVSSFAFYIGLFGALSYSFNTLAIENFSHFSVKGAVYACAEKHHVQRLKATHVMVSLLGEQNYLMARQMTDDQGEYQFFLSLADLRRVARIEIRDSSGVYGIAIVDMPTQLSGMDVVRDFLLVKNES